jgi:peptide/nickel transport system substrate-binding protein
MKFLTTLLSLFLAGCLLFVSCGGKNQESADKSPKTPVKDTLVFGLIQEPTTLDSLTSTERITFLPVYAIHDTLVALDENQKLIPRLAESWEISGDGLEYTFKIREGVKFHKGETLTIEDVAFCLNKMKELQKSNFALINKIEVLDSTHIKIAIDYPFSPLLFLFSQPQTGIVNKASYEADPKGYGRDPNGTGPFKYSSWLSGNAITLERFDDYWQGPAPLKQLVFRIIADESTELIALEAGEIDAYIQVSQNNKSIVKNNPKLTWYEAPGSQVFTLAFNNGSLPNGKKSIFAGNKALREAVAFAIDKDDVVAAAIENSAPPLYTPYPSFVVHYPANFSGNVFNREKAKAKLAEAGYPNGLTIKIRTTTQGIYSKPAEVIMGQLAEIGVKLELETMERGTYLKEVYNNFDYDLTIWAVSCDYPDADHGAYKRFYSGMISPTNNYMQINDKELDKAILTNRISQNDSERAGAVLKIAEIIRDESYCLPLYASPQTLAANSALKGVNLDFGMKINFYTWSW